MKQPQKPFTRKSSLRRVMPALPRGHPGSLIPQKFSQATIERDVNHAVTKVTSQMHMSPRLKQRLFAVTWDVVHEYAKLTLQSKKLRRDDYMVNTILNVYRAGELTPQQLVILRRYRIPATTQMKEKAREALSKLRRKQLETKNLRETIENTPSWDMIQTFKSNELASQVWAMMKQEILESVIGQY